MWRYVRHTIYPHTHNNIFPYSILILYYHLWLEAHFYIPKPVFILIWNNVYTCTVCVSACYHLSACFVRCSAGGSLVPLCHRTTQRSGTCIYSLRTCDSYESYEIVTHIWYYMTPCISDIWHSIMTYIYVLTYITLCDMLLWSIYCDIESRVDLMTLARYAKYYLL